MMNRSEALGLVKRQLTEQRFQHTIGVMETAIDLAEQYGADVKKAELAGIFHDYAKFRPKEEMRQIIQAHYPHDLLDYHSELWHAPVGEFLVRTEAGIDDADILSAIRWHTTGRKHMTLLEKIIYLADYIEPGREFPGVEEVREVAKHDVDIALLKAVTNTIIFLVKQSRPVYPMTLETYNSLVVSVKGTE